MSINFLFPVVFSILSLKMKKSSLSVSEFQNQITICRFDIYYGLEIIKHDNIQIYFENNYIFDTNNVFQYSSFQRVFYKNGNYIYVSDLLYDNNIINIRPEGIKLLAKLNIIFKDKADFLTAKYNKKKEKCSISLKYDEIMPCSTSQVRFLKSRYGFVHSGRKDFFIKFKKTLPTFFCDALGKNLPISFINDLKQKSELWQFTFSTLSYDYFNNSEKILKDSNFFSTKDQSILNLMLAEYI